MRRFAMRCTGHQIVRRKEKQDDETIEFDMLRVTCEGTGDESKNKFVFEVDPIARGKFPLEEPCELGLEFPQGRLDLNGDNTRTVTITAEDAKSIAEKIDPAAIDAMATPE